MKKLIWAVVPVLLFCGCSNSVSATPQEVVNAFSNDFSAVATAAFGENKTEMDVTKNGMSISISLAAPAELKGMGIELSDEHAKITYEGMEQKILKDSLPDGTPFLLLEDLFEDLADPDDFVLSTEEGKLIAQNDDFMAVLSSEDFSLISAKFSQYATEFFFSNWAFKDAG